jgi:hypothetical protein
MDQKEKSMVYIKVRFARVKYVMTQHAQKSTCVGNNGRDVVTEKHC